MAEKKSIVVDPGDIAEIGCGRGNLTDVRFLFPLEEAQLRGYGMRGQESAEVG